ncbi:hypothetical protein, partial [Allorhodopirellula heiligendammensis]|uniref:hypothetical protein n=1 Tax=Allorhodopirellula heiligendammensis TaxID=2714739 RepID=UPI00265F78D5
KQTRSFSRRCGTSSTVGTWQGSTQQNVIERSQVQVGVMIRNVWQFYESRSPTDHRERAVRL